MTGEKSKYVVYDKSTGKVYELPYTASIPRPRVGFVNVRFAEAVERGPGMFWLDINGQRDTNPTPATRAFFDPYHIITREQLAQKRKQREEELHQQQLKEMRKKARRLLRGRNS